MKRTKLAATIMALLMMLTALSACSPEPTHSAQATPTALQPTANTDKPAEAPETNEEPYHATFMYYASNDAAPDLALVNEKFNELTMRDLNMVVDLVPVTFGTYNQQIQLMLSGGDALDLFPMGPAEAGTYIDAQYIVNIGDYLQDYGKDVIDIVGMEDILTCSVGDFIWGIPVMMERTHPSAIVMRNDILVALEIDQANIKTLEDVGEVFAKVREAYPDMTILGGQFNTTPPPTISNHVDILGDIRRMGVLDEYAQTPTVVNYYETQGYRDLVGLMRDWYQKGYVSKDLPTSNDSGEALMRAGNLFSFGTNSKPDSKAEKDAMTGYDTAIIRYNEPLLTTWGTSTVGYAIANNSENPAKALELYNWIVATKEANDLLNWGVEGVHWEEAIDGTAVYPQGVDATNVGYHQDFGWAYPNQINSHVWNGNSPNVFDSYEEERSRALTSVAYGFSFDASKVLNEVAALSSLYDQYAHTIAAGAVDPDTAIKEFNDALYAAGLQKVIDEKQSQLDAWLKNK